MSFLKRKPKWLIFVLVLFVAGCGYHFAGSGSMPGNIRSLSVDILENRTGDTGIENIFTNDIIYEITRDKRVLLTSSDKADAVLTGVIASLRTYTISRSGLQTSNEKRLIVTVDMKLTDQSGGIMWVAKGISVNEEYQVSSDRQTTDQNKRNAITELSKRLAENIYARLTSDF